MNEIHRDAIDRLARLEPMDEETELLLARAEEGSGQLESAYERLCAARRRRPGFSPPLEMQIAMLQGRLGMHGEAVSTMQKVVELAPRLPAAHMNLAAMLAAQGREDDARAALRRSVTILPSETGLWVRLASIETHFGATAAALEALTSALRTIPVTAESWRQIGSVLSEHWQYEKADRAFSLASAMDPGTPAIETHAAFVKQELGDTQGALAALRRAAERHPDDFRVAVGEKLMLPQIYDSVADLRTWRERYADGLSELESRMQTWLERPDEVFALNRTNFLLAYQGENDRALQQRYSRLLARIAQRAAPEWNTPLSRAFDGDRPLRVGFMGSLFRDCTAGRYFERWITSLDERFQKFVYHSAPVSDEVTARIRAASGKFQICRESIRATARAIAADELDVLIYPEVGMDVMTYVLSALRLAPVQMAGWGHPVTTGSDAIDYFLTCSAMEPVDASLHYVERLIGLPGIGVNYSMPPPVPAADRERFGLPRGRRVYLCLQSLFKVHPDMDELFADVLETDPEGILVFFQGPSAQVTERLAVRLQRALSKRKIAAKGQLKFLPRVDGATFRQVANVADVVLDTIHWSGGNTSIDAISVGTPIVTIPGRYMRGRQTAAMLRMLGLDELVVDGSGEYAARAVDIARNQDLNHALRNSIQERRGELFGKADAVAALADSIFKAAIDRSKSSQ